jgi:hypothetical protein
LLESRVFPHPNTWKSVQPSKLVKKHGRDMAILGSCGDLRKLYEKTKCCKSASFLVVVHRNSPAACLISLIRPGWIPGLLLRQANLHRGHQDVVNDSLSQRHPLETPSLLLPPGSPLGAYLPFRSAGKPTIKSQRINDMDVENLLRKQDCMLKGQYNVRDDARRLCVDGYRQPDPCLAMAS